jgi:hypothetical protein
MSSRTAQSWLDDAVAAYEASTSFVDVNYRKKWEYGLRAFQNEHAPGSKYLSDDYRGRSRIFRPKTRSVIRKNEAAAALTLGNIDSIDFSPENPDDLTNLAATEALKAVVKYRLSRTIPWFHIVVGAMQDAQTVGAVCSYNYWEYETKQRGDAFKIVKDRPCIKLKPLENIRIDPASDWTNPVQTSPYFIDILPMYLCDVEAMMATEDTKTGKPKWKKYTREEIAKASSLGPDSTRQVRQGRGGKDIHEEERAITSHSIVWVLKYFMRDAGEDYCFYTLGNDKLLSDPTPLDEVYFHGVRPYTMGCTILEAHKAIPDSSTWISRHIQMESNDVANQRLDNVKLVLNKRYIVGRGRQVDIQSLVRNVPGSVTLATNPREDIMPMEWGDVTQSAYVEQQGLDASFDDLVGNFSPFTKFSGSGTDETLGRAKLAQTGASTMTEYAIQTLTETYFEPTLRQLVLLEQYYETDQAVLSTAAKNARLFPRFGYSQITDDLLAKEVLVKVNIGMGATDPQTRLQKFVAAIQTVIQVIQTAPPGANLEEITKEIFRNAGYKDGERFFSMQQQDPRLIKAMEMIKQLQGEIATNRYKIDTEAKLKQLEIMTNAKLKSDETKVNAARIDADSQLRSEETSVKAKSVDVQLLDVIMQNEGSGAEGQLKKLQSDYSNAESEQRILSEAQRRENEKRKVDAEVAKTMTETALMAQEDRASKETEAKVDAVAQATVQMGMSLQQITDAVAEIKSEMMDGEATNAQIIAMQQALKGLADAMTGVAKQVDQKRPVPVKFKKSRKPDGRKAVTFVMDDGSTRDVEEEVDG